MTELEAFLLGRGPVTGTSWEEFLRIQNSSTLITLYPLFREQASDKKRLGTRAPAGKKGDLHTMKANSQYGK